MLSGCRMVVQRQVVSGWPLLVRLEMGPFPASEAVIFGDNFTDPHILVVSCACVHKEGTSGLPFSLPNVLML